MFQVIEIITCFCCHFHQIHQELFHPNSPGHLFWKPEDLIKASRTHQAKNLDAMRGNPGGIPGDTTSCIQICQESREGTLRIFLHNSHFATQASHIRKLPFDVASFQGRVVYNFFLGCARRTK